MTITSSDPVIYSLSKWGTEIRARLQSVEAEREMLLTDLAAIDRVIEMRTGTPSPSATTNPDPQGLASLTLGQGLFHIATENDGNLIVVEAKRQLIACGKIKNAKNAGPRIYSHMANDLRFERVAPGQFRLLKIHGPMAEDGATPMELTQFGLDNA